jgi:hypothetical protein
LIVWLVAAALGLVIAAAVTLAASQLSSQRIGISGEPLSAGQELVPHARPPAASGHPRPTRPASARPAPHGGSTQSGAVAAGGEDGSGDD